MSLFLFCFPEFYNHVNPLCNFPILPARSPNRSCCFPGCVAWDGPVPSVQSNHVSLRHDIVHVIYADNMSACFPRNTIYWRNEFNFFQSPLFFLILVLHIRYFLFEGFHRIFLLKCFHTRFLISFVWERGFYKKRNVIYFLIHVINKAYYMNNSKINPPVSWCMMLLM